MKLSKIFTKTLREAPKDEIALNAQLLIRAGYIHKEMAGVYAYTTLGLRVLENIKQIVREEMNAIDGQEVMMTTLQPKELWQKTDRWDDEKVDNWFKTKLSNGSELGVGLTHEEPVVDMLSGYLSSYKDLPVLIYQIQTKFRNELRAKSGLLRGREFIMKDMYSFARNQAEHDGVYEKIAKAYMRIYKRLGLAEITYRVKADGGIFTERFSDEFQTLSPVGEDVLFHVPDSDIYFNEEVAPAKAPKITYSEDMKQMQEVEGKGVVGVVDLAKFLNIKVEQTTKTMLFETDDGRVIAAAVRGGYDVNEIKLRKAAGAKSIKLASEEIIKKLTNAEVGYAGMINLPDSVETYFDESCADRVNFEMGANKTNFHSVNLNWGKDIKEPEQFYDIKIARRGDLYPETGQEYELMNAVEVGNIFPLETKYTDALDVYYSDEDGERKSIIMGCYGFGVSRMMGVLAEVFSDDKGIVWPVNVAPFKVIISVLANSKDDEAFKQAEAIYQQLKDMNIEVLFDDRLDVRPGEKFADAELLGMPYRLVVSRRALESKRYELIERKTAGVKKLTIDELLSYMKSLDSH